MSDLARRLVACPRFRWVEGMRIASPPELASLRVAPGSVVSPHALPDLDDPATVGCVLALVREAHQKPGIYVRRRHGLGDHRAWACFDDGEPLMSTQGDTFTGPTEAAALVAAMETT